MLLAIDTSTHWIGLALYDGVQVRGEAVWQTQNHHTIELSPAVQELLDRCAVKPKDLQVIAVALGPGAFTSLRIGMAVAKGMALALHLPMVGIPTLDILAVSQPLDAPELAAILQVGRGRLAVGRYHHPKGVWAPVGDPELMTAEELAKTIQSPTRVCGELTLEARQMLARKRKNVILSTPALSLRRPSYLAELGWKRWQRGKLDGDSAANLAPIYLHTSADIPA